MAVPAYQSQNEGKCPMSSIASIITRNIVGFNIKSDYKIDKKL